MLLYTAHAAEPLPELESVADSSGLSRRLGYRPLFCTLLDPGSLADAWFRAYAASPSYVQVIDVYEVDDDAAVPMDVVTWCDECLGRTAPDDDVLTRALSPDDAAYTDYLLDVSATVRRTWRFDVLDILNGRLDGLALGERERVLVARSMAAVRALPQRPDVSIGSSLGGGYDSITLEVWYRLMLTASLMPLVWSRVMGVALLGELLALEPDVLATTPGFVEAQAHVQNIGWQDWKSNGAMSGTSGRALRLEAIQIQLTGDVATKYDVYYRVHCQNVGWMGWAKNGARAGTAGCSYRLEAMQIKLVPKGAKAPGTTRGAFYQRRR